MLENIEYLFCSLFTVIINSILLAFIPKFLSRPTYKRKYVYKRSELLMTDNDNNHCVCDKNIFSFGNYLNDIDSFVIKNDEFFVMRNDFEFQNN